MPIFGRKKTLKDFFLTKIFLKLNTSYGVVVSTMKLFLIAILIFSGSVFAAPVQALQEAMLIYALNVYAPKELVEEECRTVLTVAEKEYITICNDGNGKSYETVYRFDRHWRHIKNKQLN
jgi:hypothetical protein